MLFIRRVGALSLSPLPPLSVAPSTTGQSTGAASAVVLDASVWVSRLLPQEAEHIASKGWIDQHFLQKGLLVVPSLFVVEVTAAISRRTKSVSDAYSAANQVLAMPLIQIGAMDTGLMSEARNLAADHGLRAGDAVYVALAKQLGLPVVSLDEELRRLATAANIIAIKP
jgi:predicted nucleic acid-binding protein